MAGSYLNHFDFFNITFIDGKFYTVFSLLFGIGFALQLQRLNAGGSRAVIVYIRHLTVLLAIGLIHITQFWVGDILSTYAVLGFVLLAFHRCSDRTVLAAAIAFCLPFVGYLLAWYGSVAMDLGFYAMGQSAIASGIPGFAGDISAVIASEKWADYFAFNQAGSLIRIGYLLESWRLVKLLFIMLIGLWVGRQILNNALLQNTRFIRGVAFWGLLIGLPISVVYANLGIVGAFAGPADQTGFFRLAAYMLSVFPMGFAYAALFVLAWQKSAAVL
ncbi:MAG: hypothetical protein ACI88A_000938 [Paraglaciecola sp.]